MSTRDLSQLADHAATQLLTCEPIERPIWQLIRDDIDRYFAGQDDEPAVQDEELFPPPRKPPAGRQTRLSCFPRKDRHATPSEVARYLRPVGTPPLTARLDPPNRAGGEATNHHQEGPDVNHADRFDRDAAARIARAIEDSDDPHVNIQFTPREWVNEWFADVYGWPLNAKQAGWRDDFLAMVLAEMRAA